MLLLIHGAWHGSWAWDRVRELLPDVPAEAVDLPSAGHEGCGLSDDVATVRAAVDRVGSPVVVVAHSYGGLVATEALHGCTNVERVIYLAAFMLEPGESLPDLAGTAENGPPDWWDVRGDQLLARWPREVFYHDVPAAEAEAAIAQLTSQDLSSQLASPSVAAWKSIPSTYVICTDDRALPVDLQEIMARRADRTIRMDSSHSPMLSHTAELADLLRAEVAV